MQSMQKEYRVTFEALYEKMIYLQKRNGLPSVFALTRAEDLWQGMEKVLYQGAGRLHFLKRGRLPIVRAKQIRKAITCLSFRIRMKRKSRQYLHMPKAACLLIRFARVTRR